MTLWGGLKYYIFAFPAKAIHELSSLSYMREIRICTCVKHPVKECTFELSFIMLTYTSRIFLIYYSYLIRKSESEVTCISIRKFDVQLLASTAKSENQFNSKVRKVLSPLGMSLEPMQKNCT